MHVTELWRFPVKSLQGERLDAVEVGSAGLHGDRRYAIFDAETGIGLSARRVPELLFASATTAVDGSVSIQLPDGSVLSNSTGGVDDAALSTWLGRNVVLRSTEQVQAGADGHGRRFENVEDFEHEETSGWFPFDAATGAFQDSGEAAVSLLSEQSLGAWPQRRFRANIVVSGGGENELVGRRITIGDVQLDVLSRLGRCVMVTRPQPGSDAVGAIEKDLDVLRTIHRERGGTFAIGAVVPSAGLISVGDEVVAD